MVYPTDIEAVVKSDTGNTIEEGTEMAEIAAPTKKKRGTLTSNSHHHHHNHHRHRNSKSANNLQIPDATLVDNAFARDNTSICNKVEEKPPESVRTKFCICCLNINTKVLQGLNYYE